MRPKISKALRDIIAARVALESLDSTTVKESMDLIQALDGLRREVMRCGLRAREALKREEQTNAPG